MSDGIFSIIAQMVLCALVVIATLASPTYRVREVHLYLILLFNGILFGVLITRLVTRLTRNKE